MIMEDDDSLTLTDTVENTTFQFLYVRHFAWNFPTDNERNVGHPKKGRLYRGIYNTDTKTYRLFYEIGDETTGIYIPKLVETNSDIEIGNTYTSDIVVLTRKNILDCDITPEDLDALVGWIQSKNEYLKKITNLEPKKTENPQPTPQQNMATMMAQRENQEFMELCKTLAKLKTHDPILYDGIDNLIDFFVNNEPTGGWIGTSKVLGPGKNVGDAITHLEVYGGDDRRRNLARLDLLIAIRFLVTELMRNIIQENE